ncbi:esterase-like activity of phytase family protein [Ferrimonas balearica]|uniref:esterase-like activity of phytase family protein n=1 Tax=Ferrimonas balearica TaxID=44012 RepID=UPI001C98899E|nr:esterase-like activity of phytase family protein [Ferrimonas balearica]MBY6223433.1 esterase-like activity of phytase family protein [Ferrimonas balearica]
MSCRLALIWLMALATMPTYAQAPFELRAEPWRSDFEVLSQDTQSLRYAGTLRLAPPEGLPSHRGSWSTLVYLGSHLGFQATSDRDGHWLSFDVEIEEGELSGVQYRDHGQIHDPNGIGLNNIESMVIAGELILVGLDESPVLYQLDRHRRRAIPRFTLPDYHPAGNDGIEAIAVVRPFGPLLPISEKSHNHDDRSRRAWRLQPGKDAEPMSLPLAISAAPVDATELANGDVVLLHRHYQHGITTIGLSHYPAGAFTAEDGPGGRPLLLARSHQLLQALDNFEGIAAFERDGRQYLLLISDDNIDWQKPGRQNTLLMLIEWLQ